MDISIIIVSYNVRYFLEQLLHSIYKSKGNLHIEVIVVDNHSSDDTISMVGEVFPEVTCISNSENKGFSVANNQGISLAKGKYVLFLNPDTLIAEETLIKVFDYMQSNPQVGALGVRMVDGSGRFLPESKRGLPTPAAAFYRFSGIHKIFPKSERFNRYYMGHIGEFEKARVEVLTGAFFFCRKSILDQIGGFDEHFFMYGEDIDLSYRFSKAGYDLVYFPETTIIHYKGESTTKESAKYIKNFYEAMIIFAEKHFSKGYSPLVRLTLKIAVYFKAFSSGLMAFLKKKAWILVDTLVITAVLFGIKTGWAILYHRDPDYYRGIFEKTNYPIFLITWLTTFYLSGVYDKPKSLSKLIHGLWLGLLVNGLIYGMLDPGYRPSRPILLLGFVGLLLLIPLTRILYYHWICKEWIVGSGMHKKIGIIADPNEYERITNLISYADPNVHIAGRISLEYELPTLTDDTLGNLNDLNSIVRFHRLQEIVVAARNLGATKVMQLMNELGDKCQFKIASIASESIVGSKSKNKVGELYTQEIQYRLNLPEWRRKKRLLDLILSLIVLVSSPIIIWFFKHKMQLLSNAFLVLAGRYTWVGYSSIPHLTYLPSLKPAIIRGMMSDNKQVASNYDAAYARYYDIYTDLELFFGRIHQWGQYPNL